MKQVHYYDNDNLYTVSEQAYLNVDESRKQGKDIYYCPPMATLEELPPVGKNQIQMFDGNTWRIIKDYRHEFQVNENLELSEITYLGDIKEGYILVTEEQADKIRQDKLFYILKDGKLIENPNYEKEKAQEREGNFYKEFIATSLGNYRLEPKGYANAQQAMDVTNTMAMALGGLTEKLVPLVIFYETPDFSKAEECTEEWLVAHQKNPSVMTLEEWQKFYFEFCQLYAMQQYKSEVVNENTTDTTTDIPNEVGTKATDKPNAN